MIVKDVMYSLVCSEVMGKKICLDMLQDLSLEIYTQLYVFSKEHDIAHILASALSRAGLLKGDEISAGFSKQLMISIYRDTQKKYTINQLEKIFEAAHIPYILLKGAVLCDFYPQTWMRTSCDVDILIQKKDVDLTIKNLCNAGYLRTKDSSTHDYSFMSTNNVHIEIHYTLAQDEKMSSADRIFETVWEHYTIKDDRYNYKYYLTSEMFILYHIAHMARHIVNGGCGVRPFLDLCLINKNMSFDKAELFSLLDKAELLKFYEISLNLSEVLFGNCSHNESTRMLEEFILSGGVYGTIGNVAKVNAAKGIGKFRSVIQMMFLPKKNLQVTYPNLKKHPFLFPFYQVKRWFRFFKKNKNQKVKRSIEACNSVSREETEATMLLLKSLGLKK